MRDRFDNLQALRGIACMMVVLFHAAGFEKQTAAGFKPLQPMLWCGYAGVDLFFVLSGYIITVSNRKNLGKPSMALGFLFRRAWRIYPVFWITIGLVFFNIWLTHGYYPQLKLREVLMLPQPNLGLPPVVPVSWSLTFELLFYFVFSLLILFPRKLAPFVLSGWAGIVVLAYVLQSTNVWVSSSKYVWLATSPLILEFCLGCLIAAVVRPGSVRWSLSYAVLGVAWAVVGAATFYTQHDNWEWIPFHAEVRVAVFGPAAALIVYGMTRAELSGWSRVPQWLCRLGDWSFSIYLAHSVAINDVLYVCDYRRHISHNLVSHTLWGTAIIGWSVALGWLLHRMAERPLMNVMKKKRPVPATLAMPSPVEVEVRRAA